MIDIDYWKKLKKFFETEYAGIVPAEKHMIYIKEIINGDATLLDYDDNYDPGTVSDWVAATQDIAFDEKHSLSPEGESLDISETDTVAIFPHLFDYDDAIEEIAGYFLWEEINKFKEELKDGNLEYVETAVKLDWKMMFDEIPTIRDVFLF